MLGPLHRIAPARLTEGEEGLEVGDAAAVVPDHEALRPRLVREIHARGAGAPRVLQELRDDGLRFGKANRRFSMRRRLFRRIATVSVMRVS